MFIRKLLLFVKNIKNIILGKKSDPIKYNEKIIKNISRKGVKDCFTGDDSLSISGKQKLLQSDITKQAHSIIKGALENPETLLDFIRSKGTVIVKFRYMDKILNAFGDEEGFIPPKSGLKALIFTLLINSLSSSKLEVGFKTPAMFALNDKPINIYTLSHQLHLWLSYINDLPGFDEKTMKNFKNFWNTGPNSQDISFLSAEEMLSLKDIIAREMEALNFVKEMGREFVGQKNSVQKLREGKSINL